LPELGRRLAALAADELEVLVSTHDADPLVTV